MSKVVSARGQVIDIDLLRLKQEMATMPKPIAIQAREDFIEKRSKRRNRRIKKDAEHVMTPQPENIEDHNGEETDGTESN